MTRGFILYYDKTRQSSNPDISDFEPECAKMFLMKFCFAWFKIQVKFHSCSGVCVQGEWQKFTPLSPPLYKDEGLKNISHSMSIENWMSVVLRFHIWFVTTVYYKMRQILLQNVTTILLHGTEIAKC